MDFDSLKELMKRLGQQADALMGQLKEAQGAVDQLAVNQGDHLAMSPFMMGLTVFVLAVFIGYYVVWRVTPALHSPLMSVTNAISSVIIVGALIAAGLPTYGPSKWFGFAAVVLASVNIFGGFLVTRRMLEMFKKKEK